MLLSTDRWQLLFMLKTPVFLRWVPCKSRAANCVMLVMVYVVMLMIQQHYKVEQAVHLLIALALGVVVD
jgi:hypothetical protein